MRQFGLQLIVLILAALVLFTFQNCSAPVEEQDIAGLSLGLPFAYDLKVDHIAYMSCTAASGGPAFFTFKAGAYDDGSGLRLRDDFNAATAKFSPEAKAEALSISFMNSGVIPQISVRSTSNYQQAVGYGNFPGPLSDPTYADTLAALTGINRARIFSSDFIQGQVNFSSAGPNYAQDLRTLVNQNGLGFLGFTFYQPGGSVAAAATPNPNSPGSSAYGSGFKAGFRIPAGYTGGNPRALSGVQEKNLETNNVITTDIWDCSENYTFKIVRGGDIGSNVNCASKNPLLRCCADANGTNEEGTTPTQIDMYATLRKVLPAANWAIDSVNKCVVARTGTGSCYGSTDTGLSSINYGSGSCNPASGNCPQFVSVCKKR